METYDLELLDKNAYGLIRAYPDGCPDFSNSKISEMIAKYLDEIYDSLNEVRNALEICRSSLLYIQN